MLESFLTALRVVFPLAALMAVGALCRKVGMVKREDMHAVDTLIFKLFMPCLVFTGIYEGSINMSDHIWVAVVGILISILYMFIGIYAGKKLQPNDGAKAASVAGAVSRPNYLMFGTAISETLYATPSNVVVLMNPIMVPLNNVVGVIILEKHRSGKVKVLQLVWAILKNPIVIATLLTLALKALPFRLPGMVCNVVNSLGGLTTTLCFFSLGVGLNVQNLVENKRIVTIGCLLRMVILPLIFIPLMILLGFRGQELCVLLILIAAPTAANSYPMAISMGGDGPLAGQMLCVNVLTSLGTIFVYTFVLRLLGML